MRVIAIDPAPGKKSTVFDGAEFRQCSAVELRELINGIASRKEAVLVCWDAPLTGPFDPSVAGAHRFDFTKRPIERFFSRKQTGFKAPDGISVRGYGECPHWTITRSLLGLPRVGDYDKAESKLPLRLITESTVKIRNRPSVVEYHPGLATWLWCRVSRDSEASWSYKGNKPENCRIRNEIWQIVLDRSGFDAELPRPQNDDEFDAAIGFILGSLFVEKSESVPKRCYLLGDRRNGVMLLPHASGLADAWLRWSQAASPSLDQGGNVPRDEETGVFVQSRELVSGGLDKVSSFAGEVGSGIKGSAASAMSGAKGTARGAAGAARKVYGWAELGSKQAFASAAKLSDALLATTQGVLASSLAIDLSELIASTVSGPATIYDRAMDAEYLRAFIGGGNHRLFDGGHTIAGAWEAVRNASPDDTIIEEAIGFLDAMFKDLVTPKGLPIANWDKETYDLVSEFLQTKYGISKDWFYDLNSYDAPELLAGVIGLAAVILSWEEEDVEKFAKLVGGMGVSAAFSANPLLLTVTVISLARTFQKAEHSDEYVIAVDGLLKGGVGAGSALAAASQVAVFGGPAGLALLAGLSAGLLANLATRNISIEQFKEFVVERTTAAATEVKYLAKLEDAQPNTAW